MYSYLVDDNSERKKAKGINKTFVITISHNIYKDVLVKRKCLRHSINRIQRNDHRIGTYEIKKVFCLALMLKYTSKTVDAMISSWLVQLTVKNSFLNNYSEKLFCQAYCFNFQSNKESLVYKQ